MTDIPKELSDNLKVAEHVLREAEKNKLAAELLVLEAKTRIQNWKESQEEMEYGKWGLG
jgi:hypothetical protein